MLLQVMLVVLCSSCSQECDQCEFQCARGIPEGWNNVASADASPSTSNLLGMWACYERADRVSFRIIGRNPPPAEVAAQPGPHGQRVLEGPVDAFWGGADEADFFALPLKDGRILLPCGGQRWTDWVEPAEGENGAFSVHFIGSAEMHDIDLADDECDQKALDFTITLVKAE
jgi:hypothetical protein